MYTLYIFYILFNFNPFFSFLFSAKIQPRSASKAAPASPLVVPGSTENSKLEGKVGTGKETLRLRANGPAEIAPVVSMINLGSGGGGWGLMGMWDEGGGRT